MCKPTNEKKLTNKNGITFKELKDFINSINFIPDDSVVYIDVYSSVLSECKTKEIIADEEGLTIYDWTNE
jgi:hypothetical protein